MIVAISILSKFFHELDETFDIKKLRVRLATRKMSLRLPLMVATAVMCIRTRYLKWKTHHRSEVLMVCFRCCWI